MNHPAAHDMPTPHFSRQVSVDVWRCTGRTGLAAWAKAWPLDPAFRPVFTMRLCQRVARLPAWLRVVLLPLCRWLHLRARLRAALDIPWGLHAGPGFKLLHGQGTVINDRTRIGTNVTIMQGVTIGGTQRGVPDISDDVIVCANATVLGGVHLGKGCVVGAGAVVLCDVPPGCAAVGNPARVLPVPYKAHGYHPLPESLR